MAVTLHARPEVVHLWLQLAALETSLAALHQRLASIPAPAPPAERGGDWIVAYA